MNTRPLTITQSGFKAVLVNPSTWIFEANNLADAACLLWKAYLTDWKIVEQRPVRKRRGVSTDNLPRYLGLYKVAFLNLGFATENMLKALLLRRKKIVPIGNKLKWPKNGHDQQALAELAGLRLNKEERNILGVLSEYVTWAGRYPLPNNEDDLAIDFNIAGNHWDKAIALFGRLRLQFDNSRG